METQSGFCNACGKEMFQGARFCTYCGAARLTQPSGHAGQEVKEVFEIRKVGIGSLVKISFLVNALFGLLFGFLIAAIGITGMHMASFPFQTHGELFSGSPAWIGIVIGSTLLYGLMGALLGLTVGVLYNVLAWGVGGLKITLKKT